MGVYMYTYMYSSNTGVGLRSFKTLLLSHSLFHGHNYKEKRYYYMTILQADILGCFKLLNIKTDGSQEQPRLL